MIMSLTIGVFVVLMALAVWGMVEDGNACRENAKVGK